MDNLNNSKASLLERLKPSSKNKLINIKYKNLNTEESKLGESQKNLNESKFDFQASVVLNNDKIDVSMISVNMEEINEILGI
jgi:hypothetical protein